MEFNMANLKNTSINDTGFLQLPAGTTLQRPASPSAGMVRFNTDTRSTEWYDGVHGAWFPTGFLPPVASGGTVTNITQGGVGYRVHTFATVGTSTFTVTRGGQVEFLIVAGGGASGNGSCNAGSATGGGAGGVLQGSILLIPGAYSVIVGAGVSAPGAGNPPRNGENSSALGFTAIGGGGGGVADAPCTSGSVIANGAAGGSGGGGQCYTSNTYLGGNGTPGQGNAGSIGRPLATYGGNYLPGAGGGAGSPAQTLPIGTPNPVIGAAGGVGISSIISGTLTFYGGGGGAGGWTGTPGAAGLGNAIGGGGTNGGAGTNGRVIIRYRTN